MFEINQTIGNEQEIIKTHCNHHYSDNDGRMNATFSAYQQIIRDVVDKHNQYATHSDNQTQVLDQRVADLGKQLQYLSLSIVNARKEESVLNTALQGELLWSNRTKLFFCGNDCKHVCLAIMHSKLSHRDFHIS